MIGFELKQKLTAKELRQAEIEYYLWGNESYLPFLQIITDMESVALSTMLSLTNPYEGEFFAYVVLMSS